MIISSASLARHQCSHSSDLSVSLEEERIGCRNENKWGQTEIRTQTEHE